MMREGDYDEYMSHGVTKEQEAQWGEEFRQTLLDRLVKDPRDVHVVSSYLSCVAEQEQDLIDTLVGLLERQIKEMDAFSCLLCAERIADFLRQDGISTARHQRLATLGTDLLNRTILQPSNIDLRYKNIGYLKDMLSQDKIQSRVARALKQIRELRTIR